MGKQDHLTDGRLVGEEHRQPVDADPLPRRRRHAELERADIVLVEPVRLVVAPRRELRLLAEARKLVDRIVELAVGVGQLALPDEELEAVHQRGVLPLPLGERRELDRKVHDERRLDQRRLDEPLEELLPDPPRGSVGRLDALRASRLRERSRLGLGCHPRAQRRREPVEERQPPPRRREVDGVFSPAEREAPAERLGELGEQRLRQLHEVGVVGVRLVELEHREFGIVLGRDPLVPEVAVDLVHALEPTDDEPLEVELRRDPEIQIDVERVVVRLEWPGDGAARDRLHHRRLDLQEAARVEEPPQRRDEPRAEQEDRADVGVHDEVHVTLPIAGLHVLEAVPLLGQRPQRLREEAPRLDVDRELAGARAEHLARDADEVA